jgi:hypothetical protein
MIMKDVKSCIEDKNIYLYSQSSERFIYMPAQLLVCLAASYFEFLFLVKAPAEVYLSASKAKNLGMF